MQVKLSNINVRVLFKKVIKAVRKVKVILPILSYQNGTGDNEGDAEENEKDGNPLEYAGIRLDECVQGFLAFTHVD